MDDLFKYVKDEEERELYRFGNTEKKLRTSGVHGFLLPGTAAGLFLCIAASLFIKFSNNELTLAIARTASALGGVIFASSLLFYAMFYRQARQARGTVLYITNKNVILCEHGSYAKMPLSEITDAGVERGEKLINLPFDMSELEGERLVLVYRGADMKIPYIDYPADAAAKIKALVG